ncbi:MAG: hypothetical protein COV59_01250 [Candidatus Magasanikbacteria bacterium CG11_big_fil_rev_8_21_14_0_20_39_34]|uniref:Uncharacterized protein n=1 Tax=Candidatus Magasanikbacteria bacterium CG11_big_fil_rev_8_21_14_0_20_39_34 TaxID=1974653 RepID=A0A2H0N622_9BACT|nr:MAG: hypothetical protein COV59_01250 [Candidatus Magasanikbacteria bacterium CG11_big_fil_rev_8_21_14_0_20_39_34]
MLKGFATTAIDSLAYTTRYIFDYAKKHKIHVVLFLFLTLGISIGMVNYAHAGPVDTGVSAGADLIRGLIYVISNILLIIAKLAILACIFFLRFFVNLAAYNGYIDASTVKLGWIMVRDIANMFFVVALLIIAFMTILGAGGYEWKKAMGKLVFGAIFINFSNLICGLIIDAAHVFTITFLSAIVNAAGGNLINMFKLDKIYNMVQDDSLLSNNLRMEVLAAAIVMAFFAVAAAYTIGAYLLVMVARVVVLWTLIILSPLAFLLHAFPKGEKYASEWWTEFIHHVVAAPVMVFFLWLAFATLGNGNVFKQDIKAHIPDNIPPLDESVDQSVTNKLSISEVSTWENMANFLIAIAFLKVGIKIIGRLNVEGGGFTQGALNFAKNVATIATGVSLARKYGRVGVEKGLKAGGSFALKRSGLYSAYNLTKGAIGIGVAKHEEKRDLRAKRYEREGVFGSKIDETSGGFKRALHFGDRALGQVLARAPVLGQTTKRIEKKAEDWKDAVKFAQERHEKNLGTSATVGGKIKVTQRVRRDVQEEVSKAKGIQKSEEERARLLSLAVDEDVKKAFGKIDKTAQEYAGDLDIISGAERKTEIAKGTQHAATVRSSARLEETKEELDNKRIIELAEARASQVRGVEPVRAAAILAEAWKTVAKKSLDRFANLSWEQKVAAAGEANKGVRTATNPAEKSAALTRSIGALTSVFNEGSETGKAGYLNALSSAGFFEHETEINDDNRLQATASAILGRYVDSAGLEAALAEINGGFGNDEERDAQLRLLNDAAKTAGLDGEATLMGQIGSFFDEESKQVRFGLGQQRTEKDNAGHIILDVPGVGKVSSGTSDFDALSEDQQKQVVYAKGYEGRISISGGDYVADRIDVSKLTGADGYAKYDASGTITGFDKGRAAQLASFFDGKNDLAISRINKAFLKSLNDAKVDGTNVHEFEELIQNLAKSVKDQDAFKALTDRLKPLISSVKTHNAAAGLDDISRFFNTHHT